MRNTFNILSLSGGGIKGLFQAEFLYHLETEYKVPLTEIFDMVAGTSTGSIVASALSVDIEMGKVKHLYVDHGNEIFDSKKIKYLRSEWYSNKHLLRNLKENFSDEFLDESKIQLLLTSTLQDNCRHKTFTNSDKVKYVDAIMASSAAPYYFKSFKFEDDANHSYQDGGLWANNPSLVAIIYATRILKIPLSRIRVLSLGTTCENKSVDAEDFNGMQTWSPRKVKTLIKTMFDVAEDFSHTYSEYLLNPKNIIYINPVDDSSSDVELDNVEKACRYLPAKAQSLFLRNKNDITNLLGAEGRTRCNLNRDDFINEDSILNIGLVNFVPTRDSGSIMDREKVLSNYLMSAQKSIRIVAISLSTAVHNLNLVGIIRKILESNKDIDISIYLMDPENDALVKIMAPIISSSEAKLSTDIKSVARKFLEEIKRKNKFHLYVHSTIPSATTILIDEEYNYGTVTLECKPYGLTLCKSYSYRLMNSENSEIFNNIKQGVKNIHNTSTLLSKKKTKQWK